MHPTLFKLGSFEIPSFGVMIVLAFLAGMWLANRRAGRYGVTPQQVQDVAFWALIAGILGARIVFVALEWKYYSQHLHELWTLRFAGLTSFGGLFFGLAAVAVWARRNRVPFLVLCDLFAPAFLLGHAIGRVGCLLNGCCFGWVCPPGTPIGVPVAGDDHLHYPAQVLDSVLNLVALGFLLRWERIPRPAGQGFALFLALHGLARFLYEFLRAGTPQQVAEGIASSTYLVLGGRPLPITEAQLMALLMIVAGAALFGLFARRPRVGGDAVPQEPIPA